MATETPAAPSSHSKPCSHCGALRDVLVRCQIDESHAWVFICPGKCWRELSGGQIDGDDEHPNYRYGGMWKNKHDAVSAKKKKKYSKYQQLQEWRQGDGNDKKYTRNDRPCGTEKSRHAERRICLETPALQIRSSVSGRRKDRSTPIKEERISMFLSKVHEILYTPATDRRNVQPPRPRGPPSFVAFGPLQ